MNEKDVRVELAMLKQKVEDLNEFVKTHIIHKIDTAMEHCEKIEKISESRFRWILWLVFSLIMLQISNLVVILAK